MADLVFRANTTGGDGTLAASSIVATLPTGTTSGDLMTIWCSTGVLAPATPPDFQTPAGWTLAGSSSSIAVAGGALNAKGFLFYKIAGGGEGNVTLSTVGGTNAAMTFSRTSRINPNKSTPVAQVSWISATGGPSTSAVVSSITTGARRALIEVFLAQGTAQNATPPASMTERSDFGANGISTADEIIDSARDTGTRTFTLPASADFIWGIAEFRSLAEPNRFRATRRPPLRRVPRPWDSANAFNPLANQQGFLWPIGAPTIPGSPGAYTLTAAQGSYSLTGQALALRVARTITAGQGTYSLTGQAAGLIPGRKVAAGQGTYALTGQAAGLTVTRTLFAGQGTYALTGQAAGLRRGLVLAASQGSYGLTGFAANLVAARTVAAAQGSYSLSGQNVTLTYTPAAGSATLVADFGTYALTGQDVGLRAARILAGDFGAYTLTGQDAALSVNTAPPAPDVFYADAVGPVRKKSHRKEVEEDVQTAIAELEHVTERAQAVTDAPEQPFPAFEPVQARMDEALADASRFLRDMLSAIQRTKLQLAIQQAREAQAALQARMEAEELARVEAERAVKRARMRKAAILAAAYLFGDDEA